MTGIEGERLAQQPVPDGGALTAAFPALENGHLRLSRLALETGLPAQALTG